MSAFTYQIGANSPDSHQTNPFWFAAFTRFKHRDTFTREGLTEEQKPSNSIKADVMEEIPEILVANSDVRQWNVTTSKETHLSTLTMHITNRDVNYVAEVSPGDWVGFWVFDDKAKYIEVLKKVLGKKRSNHFDDGHKFLGRVVDVRKSRSRSPAGVLDIHYTITAQGFTELDAKIYYHPVLVDFYEKNAVKFMNEFGGSKNPTVFDLPSVVGGIVSGQNVVTQLLHICLGLGPANAGKRKESLTIDADKLRGQLLSPNRTLRIPTTIVQWVTSNSNPAKETWSYIDILRPYIGVQAYDGGDGEEKWSGFISRKRDDLSSSFNQLPTVFNGNSIWSLVSTFVNDPIDEMYTALRVDKDGYVMPSIFIRQTTLTSNPFYNRFLPEIPVTPFMSVPRWEISEDLIQSIDFGRSDALRFNWVRLHGQDQYGGNPNMAAATVQDVFIPPKIDDKDIERSGLRWYNKTINANVNPVSAINGNGNKWQAIMADILMGGHLRFQGSMTSKGIVAPICIGDNVLVDNIVFHIEGVSHSGSISPAGMKDFTTSLTLSNGVSILNDNDSHSQIKSDGGEIVYPDLRNTADHEEDMIADDTLQRDDAETIEEEDDSV